VTPLRITFRDNTMKLTLSFFFLMTGALSAQQLPFLAKLQKPGSTAAVKAAKAAGERPMIITQTSDTAIPFVTNGDGLRTRITLLNLEATAATYQIVFVTSDGFSYRPPFVGIEPTNSLRGTIQPHALVELVTDGQGGITTGWALASATGSRVVFAAHNETASPLGGWSSTTYYPGNANSKRHKIRFDNRDGYTTNITLNNINTASAAATFVVRDMEGAQIGFFEGTLESANQYVLDMPNDFPASAGIAGTVEISIPASSRSGVGVLGFRINSGNGAVDLIDAFSTVAWSQ
jgi:hypothetical protein